MVKNPCPTTSTKQPRVASSTAVRHSNVCACFLRTCGVSVIPAVQSAIWNNRWSPLRLNSCSRSKTSPIDMSRHGQPFVESCIPVISWVIRKSIRDFRYRISRYHSYVSAETGPHVGGVARIVDSRELTYLNLSSRMLVVRVTECSYALRRE